ncbi:N-acetyltransferase [Chitinophaga silvisoli]|uniref:N-acetyltransferase n=1 Tax=Chitinophaga silvisoli TaxID=2291814 RepID=A0A3E1P6S0_9BACT|nr:N-acetyltransferase [Chitinophaga silvisoli]RFM35886.1 N-acetyltransferase [Chitinophaga silvisoli]
MKINTKFTLGSQQGRDILSHLTRELAIEKFSSLVDEQILTDYIHKHFNKATLIAETNDMSNQWLVVYVDDTPAGYACITSKGERPALLAGKRAMCIADFGVLHKYATPAVIDSLFEKCLSVCQGVDGIWITEYAQNPLILYFESKGFTLTKTGFQATELPLKYVSMIR